MKNQQVLATLQEAMTNLQPLYGEDMTAAIQATELDPASWYTLVTMKAASKPINLDHFQALNPFGRIELFKARIQPCLEKGVVAIDPDTGGYHLTAEGRQAASRPFEVAHEILDTAEPMDKGKLKRLADLLEQVIHATLEADQPASKLNILRSRTTDPGPDAGPVTRIDQYITDLIGYRDDAHNGAWRPHGCSAEGWDVLTAVWREQNDRIQGLAEQFEARGYTEASLQEAVDEISALGWLSEADGKLSITAAGAKLRQETEDLTDQYYFGPWSTLSKEDRQELEALLTEYNQALAQRAETA